MPDLKNLKGYAYLKRAMMVASAGGHHLLLFGPKGGEQYYAANCMESLLPAPQKNCITVLQAGQSIGLDHSIRLVLTADSCPCGKLGQPDSYCGCSRYEIQRYWKTLIGRYKESLDIRVPVEPLSSPIHTENYSLCSADIQYKVKEALKRQCRRFHKEAFKWNRDIPAERLGQFCGLSISLERYLTDLLQYLKLSSAAGRSVLKISRTITDLAGREIISQEDLEEAAQYRRFGDSHYFWSH